MILDYDSDDFFVPEQDAPVSIAVQNGLVLGKETVSGADASIRRSNLTVPLKRPRLYANSCIDVWILTAEGTTYIEVLFDARTALEEDFDFLYVYSEQDQLGDSRKNTGAALAGQTIRIAGDAAKIKLKPDDSGIK